MLQKVKWSHIRKSLIINFTLGQKKVVLFPEIGRVKNFLSVTCPHSRICSSIYIFDFNEQTSKKQKQEYEKVKESKDKKRMSPENRLKKNKFAAARLKNFLVTHISGNKSTLFWPYSKKLYEKIGSRNKIRN